MKLIKNDYIIEGTPKEIDEFLENENKGNSSKVNNNNNNYIYNEKFILTRDTTLCYENLFNNPHNGICSYREHLPKRWFWAPKGTILEHIDFRYYDLFGKRLKVPSPIFKDKDGVEVTIPYIDRFDGAIKKINEGSLSDLMGKVKEEIKEPTKGDGNKGYKVVKEGVLEIPRGLVLKHVTAHKWVDTEGSTYILHEDDLIDYNKGWIEDKFNRYKDKGNLLLQADPFIYKYKNFALTVPGMIVLKQVVVEDEVKGFSGRGTIQWVDTEGNTHKNFTHLELTDGFKKGLDNMFKDYKYKGKLLCREDVVGLEGEDYI